MSNPFLEALRRQVKRPDYRPSTKSELARQLGVASRDRAAFREALRELEEAGELACGKRSRYAPPAARHPGLEPLLTGTIFFPAGEKRRHGFFRPDPELAGAGPLRGLEGDLFVPGRHAGTALHGDRVSVKLAGRPEPPWQRHAKGRRPPPPAGERLLEARVIAVLARGMASRVTGTARLRGRHAHLEADHPSLPSVFNLEGPLLGARDGDKAVAELVAWDSPRLPPRARLTEVLGRPDDPGVDILAVIRRLGLPARFPEAALAEAEALPDAVEEDAALARREDWRDREVFTIDPEDAKDFDDAIHVAEIPAAEGGGWELAVHIADVSAYVKPGAALDREAAKRGNSVYLADRVIPMLPEKLSNGLCSLKPGVDRLTRLVAMRFGGDGRQLSARMASAVIRSRRRFTYEEAFALMKLAPGEEEGLEPDDASLVPHLRRAWDLARRLRERRFRAGALDLDFPEVRAVLDDRGRAVGVKRIEHDESHQLIEEFMLAANEAVARETKNALAPSLYRVHEDPDPDKLREFAFQANACGFQAGDVTVRAELQKLLRAIRGKPEEHSLKIALLKSLKRAAYSAEPMGHYGLSKVNYTHFTSPIRRYADLVVHRVIGRLHGSAGEEAPAGGPLPSQGQLAEIARHISETERVAADAEQETQRLKLIEYLVRISGEEGGRAFEGIIYDMKPIGAFVELTDLLIKGLLRRDDLGSSAGWRFDPARGRLAAGPGRGQLAIGQRVKVRVARVDRSRGYIDFVLAED